MAKFDADLFWLLRNELRFLESGGYVKVSETAGRPARIFEDSPSCPNYDNPLAHTPCADCALLALVPPEMRDKPAPCRHIVINSAGETVGSVRDAFTDDEIEQKVGNWLRRTIQAIEHARIRSMPWFPKPEARIRTYRA